MKSILSIILLIMLSQDSLNIIVDFKDAKTTKNWQVVNDGVMGGLSKGQFDLNDDGNAVFKGYITTENNGGFSSVRHTFKSKDVSNYSTIEIKLKGDGKKYQCRVKNDENQRDSYIQTFETSGDWEIITIPLNSFFASFRGRKLDKPNYDGKVMEEITFLIGNGKEETFRLEIERIYLK